VGGWWGAMRPARAPPDRLCCQLSGLPESLCGGIRVDHEEMSPYVRTAVGGGGSESRRHNPRTCPLKGRYPRPGHEQAVLFGAHAYTEVRSSHQFVTVPTARVCVRVQWWGKVKAPGSSV